MRYNFTLVKLSILYNMCRRSIRVNVTRSITSYYGPTVRHDPRPRRRDETVFGGFAHVRRLKSTAVDFASSTATTPPRPRSRQTEWTRPRRRRKFRPSTFWTGRHRRVVMVTVVAAAAVAASCLPTNRVWARRPRTIRRSSNSASRTTPSWCPLGRGKTRRTAA